MPTRNLQQNSQRINKQLSLVGDFVTDELLKSYKDALDDIRGTIARLYDQYQVTGEFTRAQRTQFLRLSNIEAEIIATMRPYLERSEDLIKQASLVSFDRSFFQHGWAIDQAAGVNIGWGMVSETAVRAGAGIGGDLAELSGILPEREVARHARLLNDAFVNYDRDTQRWISRQVRDGIIKGDSVQKLARRLDDNALMHSVNSAIRIARTETLRATGLASQIAYDEAADLGVNIRQVWDATLDDRTRPDHAAADGTVMQDGSFDVPWGSTPGPRRSGIAGQDINCRCTVTPEVEGLAPSVRRTRDDGIQPYQTFDEWATTNGITTNRFGQEYNF